MFELFMNRFTERLDPQILWVKFNSKSESVGNTQQLNMFAFCQPSFINNSAVFYII